ncbi:MAG: CvpA family protein [Planctomycetaceae bacterium]|nr:CvpA family protein [Planctomycetales bacterium]MCB9927033.1 CvpA family protein [Planctomycetaceae bacterium]
MEIYDIIMLAVLAGAMLFGAWKGLAWQIASLGAIVASSYVALKYDTPLAASLPVGPPWDVPLAWGILFVGTSFVIWIIFRYVSDFIDRLKLKEFDRQIGALFGLAKGVLICVIVTVFLVSLVDSIRAPILRSYSAYYIAVFLDKAHAYLPEDIHDKLEPAIHSLDERLGGHGTAHPGDGAIRTPDDAKRALNSYVDSASQQLTDRFQEAVSDHVTERLQPSSEPGLGDGRLVPFDEWRQAFERVPSTSNESTQR